MDAHYFVTENNKPKTNADKAMATYYHRSTTKVAFTATFKFETSVSTDKVPFDQVMTNLGGHYNRQFHAFICPYDAMFYFT